MTNSFYPGLLSYVQEKALDFSKVPRDRIKVLESLSSYVRESEAEQINLIFICTHNSRRSHLSQIWAQVAAAYHKLDHINTFSGGTEATAFNERAVAAMQRAGLEISTSDVSDNPHYRVSFSKGGNSLEAFSKTYDNPANAQENFAAIMTCSHAEEACPFVPGAKARISLHYDDPKDFDGTELEDQKYDERTEQIAREMFYVMSKV